MGLHVFLGLAPWLPSLWPGLGWYASPSLHLPFPTRFCINSARPCPPDFGNFPHTQPLQRNQINLNICSPGNATSQPCPNNTALFPLTFPFFSLIKSKSIKPTVTVQCSGESQNSSLARNGFLAVFRGPSNCLDFPERLKRNFICKQHLISCGF